jgi:hypothetical protein
MSFTNDGDLLLESGLANEIGKENYKSLLLEIANQME